MKSAFILLFLINNPPFTFFGSHWRYPVNYPMEKIKYKYGFETPINFDTVLKGIFYTPDGKVDTMWLLFENKEPLTLDEKNLFLQALGAWLDGMQDIGTQLPPWGGGRTGYETIDTIYNDTSKIFKADIYERHTYHPYYKKDTIIEDDKPAHTFVYYDKDKIFANERIITHYYMIFNKLKDWHRGNRCSSTWLLFFICCCNT